MARIPTPSIASLFLAVALCAAPGAAGAQFVYEPFDYPAGTILDGTPATGVNLTGTYTGNIVPPGFDLLSASPGLGYGSLIGAPAPAANRLSQMLGTTAATATASFASEVLVGPGTEIYFSALFTFDDSANGNHLAHVTLANDIGDEIGFGESTVGVRAIRVSADTGATAGLLAVGDDLAFDNGQTLFLVGRYTNSVFSGADRLDLIGYDTAQTIALPAAFDPGDPNAQFAYALVGANIDMARIGTVTFAIRGTDNNFIDELRIGNSYAAVAAIPEPQTIAFLLVGLGFMAVAAQRRRLTRARPGTAPGHPPR